MVLAFSKHLQITWSDFNITGANKTIKDKPDRQTDTLGCSKTNPNRIYNLINLETE